MPRLPLACLAGLVATSLAGAQVVNPDPAYGSTVVTVQARSAAVDVPVTKGGTVEVKVSVDVNDEHHSYQCDIEVSTTLVMNKTTRAQAAADLKDKLEKEIAMCLQEHGQNPKDASKFLKCAGASLVIRGTIPGQGHNDGTREAPIVTYPGRLKQAPRTRYYSMAPAK